jgi:hypothetical protein
LNINYIRLDKKISDFEWNSSWEGKLPQVSQMGCKLFQDSKLEWEEMVNKKNNIYKNFIGKKIWFKEILEITIGKSERKLVRKNH